MRELSRLSASARCVSIYTCISHDKQPYYVYIRGIPEFSSIPSSKILIGILTKIFNTSDWKVLYVLGLNDRRARRTSCNNSRMSYDQVEIWSIETPNTRGPKQMKANKGLVSTALLPHRNKSLIRVRLHSLELDFEFNVYECSRSSTGNKR